MDYFLNSHKKITSVGILVVYFYTFFFDDNWIWGYQCRVSSGTIKMLM